MSNKSRQHSIVVYNALIVEAIENIFQHVCYIMHDKDTTPDGVIKTAHYHVLAYSENAKTSSAVVKAIQTECKRIHGSLFFEVAKDTTILAEFIHAQTTDVIAYLTHANAEGKYQYPECYIDGEIKWWKEHSQELNDELLTEREDWTVSLLTLISDDCRTNNGAYLVPRSKVLALAKDHGRDLILNFKRALDSLFAIYGYEIIVYNDTKKY